MDVSKLNAILNVGLPIWILVAGGLLSVLIDAIFGRKSSFLVYLVGILSLIFSFCASFIKWTGDNADLRLDFLVLDSMTIFFIVVILLIAFFSLLNSYSYLKVSPFLQKNSSNLKNAYVSLILFSVVGMIFMFASDQLILNFIGLETMSLAIYILVGSNRRDSFACEAAIKYFVLGSVASAILLLGIALFYASYATFQLSEMATVAIQPDKLILPQLSAVFLLVGVFFKLSIAPFHFWTPDAYTGAPTPVTGFMASGVKIAGFAFLMRLLLNFKSIPSDPLVTIMQAGVVLTLIVGNLGAIFQDNIKRMLAYSSIAHAGYILLGLVVGFKDGVFDPQVTSSVLFYLLSYAVMTLGAFGVLSVMVNDDHEVTTFKDLAGLSSKRPALALVFSVFMISFLGIPPTIGFFAKYGIFSFAIQNGYYELSIFAIITSLASAYYYLRPIKVMYFDEATEDSSIPKVPFPLMLSIMLCLVATILLGIIPDSFVKISQQAVSILQQ